MFHANDFALSQTIVVTTTFGRTIAGRIINVSFRNNSILIHDGSYSYSVRCAHIEVVGDL